MTIQRPVEPEQAVSFARAEFGNRTVYWPRLLVAAWEDQRAGRALQRASEVYVAILKGRGKADVAALLDPLQQLSNRPYCSLNVDELKAMSRRIWEDPKNRSVEKRGVTRLYDALAFAAEGKTHEYEVQVTRALSMLCNGDEDAKSDQATLEHVLAIFERDVLS